MNAAMVRFICMIARMYYKPIWGETGRIKRYGRRNSSDIEGTDISHSTVFFVFGLKSW